MLICILSFNQKRDSVRYALKKLIDNQPDKTVGKRKRGVSRKRVIGVGRVYMAKCLYCYIAERPSASKVQVDFAKTEQGFSCNSAGQF